MNTKEIPKNQDAISCYFCRYYFLTDVSENKQSSCTKHWFNMDVFKNGFSPIFSRCDDFEETEIKK